MNISHTFVNSINERSTPAQVATYFAKVIGTIIHTTNGIQYLFVDGTTATFKDVDTTNFTVSFQ